MPHAAIAVSEFIYKPERKGHVLECLLKKHNVSCLFVCLVINSGIKSHLSHFLLRVSQCRPGGGPGAATEDHLESPAGGECGGLGKDRCFTMCA